MADTKTSDETAATALDGSELVRIVQSASSKKTTAAVLGHQFRGASVYVGTNATAVNFSGPYELSEWDTENYDTDGFWTASPNPERLTIPSGLGIKKVRVSFSHHISSVGSNQSTPQIRQYNSGGTKIAQKVTTVPSDVDNTRAIISWVFPVSDGDYFTAWIYNSDTSGTIESADQKTEFQIEVLQMDPV